MKYHYFSSLRGPHKIASLDAGWTALAMGVRRNFSREGATSIFCLWFSSCWWCKANGRSQNVVTATVTKMHFFLSNSQVYYSAIMYTIGFLQLFQAGYVFSQKHCHGLNETTNYDFILPSKTCQRHLQTRAANVWDLVQAILQ